MKVPSEGFSSTPCVYQDGLGRYIYESWLNIRMRLKAKSCPHLAPCRSKQWLRTTFAFNRQVHQVTYTNDESIPLELYDCLRLDGASEYSNNGLSRYKQSTLHLLICRKDANPSSVEYWYRALPTACCMHAVLLVFVCGSGSVDKQMLEGSSKSFT